MPTSLNKYLDPAGLDETVLNIRQIAEQLEADMQDLPYARPDGIYPDMTVGSVIGTDESAQWATRESTGTGSAIVRSVQGADVVWNQLCTNDGATATANGLTATNNGDGSWTLNGTPTAQAGITIMTSITLATGHKILVKGCPVDGGSDKYFLYFFAAGVDFGNGGIYTVSTTTQGSLRFIAKVGTSFDNVVMWPQCIDLTQMFGSGNEPATVAEFEQMYPASYYPYSAPTLKPVQIAGIASTDAQGGEVDSIEWPTQTLWDVDSENYDELRADASYHRISAAQLDTLNWSVQTTSGRTRYRALLADCKTYGGTITAYSDFKTNLPFDIVSGNSTYDTENTIGIGGSTNTYLYIGGATAASVADLITMLHGYQIAYIKREPIVTQISPALDMTYRVQAGGSESIIVPAGEVSAAPVLTIAEPVNAGDEFARIWEAIQSLGYTRNAAQLSRPVSLTDVGNIDEVQKDTTDVVEIDTTKEVQE